MLVLSRRRNEVIHIGDDIRVSVLNVKGSRVTIGIEAPSEVPVNRAELQTRIDLELAPDSPARSRREEFTGAA